MIRDQSRMRPHLQTTVRRFRTQREAAMVLDTYLRLHEGKAFQHWLWAALDRVVAGDPVDSVMADMGYRRDDP